MRQILWLNIRFGTTSNRVRPIVNRNCNAILSHISLPWQPGSAVVKFDWNFLSHSQRKMTRVCSWWKTFDDCISGSSMAVLCGREITLICLLILARCCATAWRVLRSIRWRRVTFWDKTRDHRGRRRTFRRCGRWTIGHRSTHLAWNTYATRNLSHPVLTIKLSVALPLYGASSVTYSVSRSFSPEWSFKTLAFLVITF